MNDDPNTDSTNGGQENPFRTPSPLQDTPHTVATGGVPMFDGSKYVRQISIVAILMILNGVLLTLAGGALTAMGVFFGTTDIFNGANVEVDFDEFESDGEDTGDFESEEVESGEVEAEAEAAGDGGSGGDGGGQESSEGEDSGGDDSIGGEIDDADEGDEPLDGDGAAEIEGLDGAFQTFLTAFYGGIGIVILLIGLFQIYAGIRNLSFKGRNTGIAALSVGILTAFTCYCAPTSLGLAIYGLIVYLNPAVAHAFDLRSKGHTKDDILARFPT